jgi:hypothetical protein
MVRGLWLAQPFPLRKTWGGPKRSEIIIIKINRKKHGKPNRRRKNYDDSFEPSENNSHWSATRSAFVASAISAWYVSMSMSQPKELILCRRFYESVSDRIHEKNLCRNKTNRNNYVRIHFDKSYRPTYTLAGFDLTTHSSNLLGGRRRRYHKTTPPGLMYGFLSTTWNIKELCPFRWLLKFVKKESYQIFTSIYKPNLADLTSIPQKIGSKWLQKILVLQNYID